MGNIHHADPGLSLDKDTEYVTTNHHVDSQGNSLVLSRTATIIVAASDSSDADKAGADYICPATAADVTIALAIADIP